jgi:hypothetical protein
MRFAKLEMALILAYFFAIFDFELSDREGNPSIQVPTIDRNQIQAQKPSRQQFLRYKRRE